MQLVKNIQGTLYDDTEGDVGLYNAINGTIQGGVYINFFGYTAFLQDYSQVEAELTPLPKPASFGLRNTNNIPMVTIEVNN